MRRQETPLQQLDEGALGRLWRRLRVMDRRRRISDLIVCFGLASLAAFLLRHDWQASGVPNYQEGEIAERTVRVPRSMEITDREATEAQRLQILNRVPDVYDFDSGAVQSWVERWNSSVKAARVRVADGTAKDPEEEARLFSEGLGVGITADEYKVLRTIRFGSDLLRSAYFSLGPLEQFRIVDSKKIPADRPVVMTDLRSGQKIPLQPRDFEAMTTAEEAQALVGKLELKGRQGKYRVPWLGWPKNYQDILFSVHARMVRSNLTLNRKETENLRQDALKTFRPVVLVLGKGEVVAREGERVNPRAAMLLAELSRGKQGKDWSRYPLEIIYGGLMLWFLGLFLRRQYPKTLARVKDNWVALGLLILSIVAFKLTMYFQIEVVADHFTNLPMAFFLFLIPVATPVMVLRLLTKSPIAVVFTLLHGVVIALVMEKAAFYGLHVVITGLTGTWVVNQCRTRNELYRAGFRTALVCGISAFTLSLAWGGELPLTPRLANELSGLAHFSAIETAVWGALGGLIGGWLASALTMAITPILESSLDYTTDLKLLELARMDHPLLRDLVVKAPGTYHHSMVVGSLVEAAAEAIGANALLARVGSYYHDIGKMERPQYFAENQQRGVNPHDATSPQLSAKIILSHVKYGSALAKQYKLGNDIIDFIEQHHGTSIVAYFYNKAKQEAAKPSENEEPDRVSQEEFRYPGPKPQSVETALVAMADSVEAATRSLVDPTPARIEGMVTKIVNNHLNEGTLDEADISLRQVKLVGKAFTRILLGIHHHRIEYPDQEKGLPASKKNLALVKTNT